MTRCSVCRHPERTTIDRELLAGETPLRAIGRRYGLSKTALIRHQQAHIPQALTQAKAAAELAHADGLMGEVQRIMADCRRIQAAAEADGDLRCALAALATMGRQVETLAKLAIAQREMQAAAPPAPEHDLSRLSDEELEELLRLECKMQGEELPSGVLPSDYLRDRL